MPALVFLGRRWHAATDDMAFPAGYAMALHASLLAVSATGLRWLQIDCQVNCTDASQCSLQDLEVKLQKYKAYLAGLVSLDGLLLLLSVWMMHGTLQGSILDVHKRKAVAWAVNAVLATYLLLLGMNTYGTHIYTWNQRAQCLSFSADPAYSVSSLFLVAIFGHWASLAAIATLLVIGFNPFQNHRDVRSWERRCTCLARLLCCSPGSGRRAKAARLAQLTRVAGRPMKSRSWMHWLYKRHHHSDVGMNKDGEAIQQQLEELQSTSQMSPLATLAAIFSYFYSHVDLTLSDLATCLMLVGLQQQMDRAEKKDREQQPAQSSSPHHVIQMPTGPQPIATNNRIDREANVLQSDTGSPLLAPMLDGHSRHVTASGHEHSRNDEAPRDVRISVGGSVELLTSDNERRAGNQHAIAVQLPPENPEQDVNHQCHRPDPHHLPNMKTSQVADCSSLDIVSEVPTDPITVGLLEDAHNYFKYALAAYGWPMYVFMSARLAQPSRCLRLCAGCCPCCPWGTEHPELKQGIAPQLLKGLTVQAIQELTGLDPATCLLVLNLVNESEWLLPYLVLINPDTKEFIITVRGSMSQHDVLTDLICEPAKLPPSWLSGEGFFNMKHLAAGETGTSTHSMPDNNTGTQQGSCGEVQPVDDNKDAGSQIRAGQLDPEACVVHRGILASAQAILEDLADRGVVAGVLGGNQQALAKLNPKQQRLIASLGTGAETNSDQSRPAPDETPMQLQPPIEQQRPSRIVSNPLLLTPGSMHPGHSTHSSISDNIQLPATNVATLGTSTSHQSLTGDHKDAAAAGTSITTTSVRLRHVQTQPNLIAENNSNSDNDHSPSGSPSKQTSRPILSLPRVPQLLPSPSWITGLINQVMPKGTDGNDVNKIVPHPNASKPWRVKIVGHSLGAGVAALLALHLKAALPTFDVKCWAFAPPGGLLSPELSHSMAGYCTSVVIGRDMIPRLSFSCMDKLNRDMLRAAALCKVPKALVWPLTILGRDWKREQLFRSQQDVPPEVWSLVEMYAHGLETSESAPRFQAAHNFCMPGRVLYYECAATTDELGDLDPLHRSRRRRTNNSPAASPRAQLPFHAQSHVPSISHDGHHSSARHVHESAQQQHAVITIHADAATSTRTAACQGDTTEGNVDEQNDSGQPLQQYTHTSTVSADSSTPLQPQLTRANTWWSSLFGSGVMQSLRRRSKTISNSSSSKRSLVWSAEGTAGRNKRFAPRWSSPAEISRAGMLVSRRMFAMHVPDYQAAVLEECLFDN